MFFRNTFNGLIIRKTPFWRAKHFMLVVTSVLSIVLVIGLMKPASAAVAYVGSTVGDNGAGSTTVTISNASTNSNQLLVAIVSLNGSATITGPTGWVQINTQAFGSSTRSSTFYRVQAISGEPTSYNFTLSASVKTTAVMAAYSGVDLTNPVDVQSATTVAAANTSMSTIAVTTTVPNTMLVAMYGKAVASTFTAGSSMTMRGQTVSSGGGSAGTKVTSGLQDILQASTGSSGVKIMTTPDTTGAATAHLVALRPAPIVSQVGYRWFANNTTAGTVGSPLAAQDTTATAPAPGQPFRLRMLLGVTEGQLAATSAYKLQYEWRSSGSCSPAGTFTDITANTPIKYYDNAGVTDAASIVTSGNDPVRSGVTKVTQTYEELNNFTVATAIPVNQDGMWDFALTLGLDAEESGQYCIKAVNSSGSELSTISQMPSLSMSLKSTSIIGQEYRFFQNTDAATPGSPLGATNTSVTLGTTGDQFRLRAGIRAPGKIKKISNGGSTICTVSSENKPYCWGSDSLGQLGDNATLANQSTPVAVNMNGVLSGRTILKISTGFNHTCAITDVFEAYCWGRDTYGQLGNDATLADQPNPVAVNMTGVLSGKTILDISVGTNHTCAIASDNLLYCWGFDAQGQLGDSASLTNQALPTAVATTGVLSGKTILSVSSAQDHTCAVASDNLSYCWGDDANGQLGNDVTLADQPTAVAVNTAGVLSGKTLLSISAGALHTCGIASDNQAYCWGSDTSGALGNGATTGTQPTPVAVDISGVLSGKTILSISVGAFYACVIASDNQAYCWGGDSNGQLGNDATLASQSSAVAVNTSGSLLRKTILSISASSNTTCAIASDNQAYCWGGDSNGQLGNDTTLADQPTPVAVFTNNPLSGSTVTNMGLGKSGGCALASSQISCWGDDVVGQLGDNADSVSQTSPVAVDTTGVLSGKTVLNISGGGNHSCVIASDNLAYCWGADAQGQLGNDATLANQRTPVAVNTTGALSGKTILSISAGGNHTCAIASDNLAYCWGDDVFGQLGDDGTVADKTTPAAVDTSGVLSGKTILSISAGDTHTCAIASDNQAYCWGLNTLGKLGDNSQLTRNTPVAVNTAGVLSGKTILSISAGGNNTCAIASDNQAYCWGNDANGQLGNDVTIAFSATAVAVNTAGVLSGKTILSISAGATHVCAIASDNQAYCWGNDGNGQLGNDVALVGQPVPATVSNTGALGGRSITKIFAGLRDQTCAITNGNNSYCWGSDVSNQLGDNTEILDQPLPVPVSDKLLSTPHSAGSTVQAGLYFAQKTAPTCSAQTGFTAVTNSTLISFHDNASVTNSSIMTLGTNNPVASNILMPQAYFDSSASVITNLNLMTHGTTSVWDFSLKDNGAPASTTYCLRLAAVDGTGYGDYSSYPEITTASSGGGGPTLDQMTRGGQSVINGIKNIFSW